MTSEQARRRLLGSPSRASITALNACISEYDHFHANWTMLEGPLLAAFRPMLDLFREVLSYIREPEPPRFESLALAVFRYQAVHVPIYRSYLANLRLDPSSIRSFQEIPPITTLAFKYARIANELHRESPGARIFLTSGTSVGPNERGRHLVPVPEIYRVSALRHLGRMIFPDKSRMAMLALHPSADDMPESSLAQMITWCIDRFGNGTALIAATRESVDVAQALAFLHTARRLERPVCILGTTASCAELFTGLRASGSAISLPAGSRLMDTGGVKGQRIPLTPEKVVDEAHLLLGISPPLVINEYGMTEMCSQLYDATSFNSESKLPPGLRMKLAPPWLRPAALDPITLKPNTDTQPGMLAFFDLANVGSVCSLVTEDIGIVKGDSVMILGRAAAADPRGCALAIQQFAEAGGHLPPFQPRTFTGGHAVVASRPLSATALEDIETVCNASAIKAASIQLRHKLSIGLRSADPDALGAVFRQIVHAITSGSGRWQFAISRIAEISGYSESLLAVSLQALVNPVRSVAEFVRKIRPRRDLFGFIMPGNVPGAGIHELVTTLAAGGAALVKTSSSEPIFFAQLAQSLRELDSRFGTDLGARLQVFNWARERIDLTAALLENCDRVIAFGNDATIDQLQELAGSRRPIAFGSRLSAAAVMREAAVHDVTMARTADALALDCAMFDQRGCLSPHHIFVEERSREFVSELAAALSRLNPLLSEKDGSRALDLQDSAAIRRVRESARWRKLGDRDVELWEDPNFRWTVVFDREASITPSPGFRTIYVSPFSDPYDLERRLQPARGSLEGFAIAGGESHAAEFSSTVPSERLIDPPRSGPVREVAERYGATYICKPGEMQSPPLDWAHGGGDFIRMFIDRGARIEPGA
jgi:Acyl-CoA reductase (LuxC)/Acyl-protein synthetase, LuxE